MKKIFSMACVAMFSLAVHAQQCGLDDVKVDARVGYNLGGTSPVGLPASIRELKSYDLTPSFLVGVDAEKPLASRLGLLMGLRLENKGMNVDARVKNYHMRISKGQQQLEGQFTGEVKTKVAEWMLHSAPPGSLAPYRSLASALRPLLVIRVFTRLLWLCARRLSARGQSNWCQSGHRQWARAAGRL